MWKEFLNFCLVLLLVFVAVPLFIEFEIRPRVHLVFIAHLKNYFQESICCTHLSVSSHQNYILHAFEIKTFFALIVDVAIWRAAKEGCSIGGFSHLTSVPAMTTSTNFFDEYKSPLWNSVYFSYLNDSWARLELFYSAAIPIPADFGVQFHDVTVANRLLYFDSTLRQHYDTHTDTLTRTCYRPHFVYGSHESATLREPLLLPQIDVRYLDRYDPTYPAGLQCICDEREVDLVKGLTEEVKVLLDCVKLGYDGEFDNAGKRNGRGTMHYVNGHIYTGEWKYGLRHGYGVYRFYISAEKDIYAITVPNNNRENRNGRLNNNIYEGEWRDGFMWGQGKLTCSNGNEYKGSLQISIYVFCTRYNNAYVCIGGTIKVY